MKRVGAMLIVGVAMLAACALVTNLDDLQSGSEASSTCDAPSVPCLVGLDPMWRPVSVTLAGCAPGWSQLALRTNPRPRDGGCACGACALSYDAGCSASAPIMGGPACTNALADAAPGTCTVVTGLHVEAVHTTVAPACTVSSDAGPGESDELDLCAPGCNSDYCGTAERCVLADGDTSCPTGFTRYALAGTDVTQGCSPCTCTVTSPATCTGTVTAFASNDCTDGGLTHTYAFDLCNVFDNTSYQSLRVDYAPPAGGTCTTTGTFGTADASLVGTKTICCK